MTKLEKLEAAGRRAGQIREWLQALSEAENTLDKINKWAKPGDLFKVPVTLRPGDRYGNGADTIMVGIDFGVVQQSAVYAVDRARRQIVRLGGDLPQRKPEGTL